MHGICNQECLCFVALPLQLDHVDQTFNYKSNTMYRVISLLRKQIHNQMDELASSTAVILVGLVAYWLIQV